MNLRGNRIIAPAPDAPSIDNPISEPNIARQKRTSKARPIVLKSSNSSLPLGRKRVRNQTRGAWTVEDLNQALESIENGILSIRKAAKHYGIPQTVCDGHGSHVTTATIQKAKEMGLHIIQLPAHTSHKLQPLDVSCFSSFKYHFRNNRSQFMHQHMDEEKKEPTKEDLAALVSDALQKSLTPTNITAGFCKTGIWPFNSNAVAPEPLADHLASQLNVPTNVPVAAPPEQEHAAANNAAVNGLVALANAVDAPEVQSATIQPAQAGPAATEPEVAQAGPTATGPAATEPEHAQAGPAATEPEHAQAGPAATAQKKRARLPPGLVGKLYVTSDEVIRARLEHQQQIEEAARIRKEKMEEKKVLQEKRKAAKEIELKRKEEARIARQQKKKVHSTVKKAKRKRVVIEDSSDDEEVMVIELARERAKTRRGCASTSNGLQLEVNIPIQVEDQDATSMQVENQSNVNILQDSQDHNDQDTCIGCSIEDTHICSWDEHCRNRKQNDEEQEEFGSPAEYWTEPDGYHGRDNVNCGDSQETNSEDSRRKTKALDEVYRKEADDHLRKYGL